jgi:CRISPR-associated endonuclease/helicase Cas3
MPTALTESRLMNGIGLSKTRREEHLRGTAELAASFAAEFGCWEWGRLAGLWHDLGKYSKDFQEITKRKRIA